MAYCYYDRFFFLSFLVAADASLMPVVFRVHARLFSSVVHGGNWISLDNRILKVHPIYDKKKSSVKLEIVLIISTLSVEIMQAFA